MHQTNTDFDLNLKEIAKIEGAASLEIKVRAGRVETLKFSISEWKRFYTQAIRGKPAAAVPQLVARICGTCSNAHLLCSLKAVENAFHIEVTPQTKMLRKLLHYGLLIRDHALHLYVFSLPDLLGRNSILDFDEENPREHELLHDAFAVKEIGNLLSVAVGGRSVHAPFPVVGGFSRQPKIKELKELAVKLGAVRGRILRLMEIYRNDPAEFMLQTTPVFSAMISADFSFLEGNIRTTGEINEIKAQDFGRHFKAAVVPYSQARGFKLDGEFLMVGALARLNLGRQYLHEKTRRGAVLSLDRFPSQNLHANNLAQGLEILHAVDSSVEIIDKLARIDDEAPVKSKGRSGTGTGVIEAPRGTLYHHYEIDDRGCVVRGEIAVPTGQNQLLIEQALKERVQELVSQKTAKEKIVLECEKLIRAFDPCMSCAAHFLRVKWR